MKIYTIILLVIIVNVKAGLAQCGTLSLRNSEYQVINRVQTLSGSLSDEMCFTTRPLESRDIVAICEQYSQSDSLRFNNVDKYNIDHIICSHYEYANKELSEYWYAKRLRKTFYKSKYDFLYTKKSDFTASINPIFTFGLLSEKGSSTLGYTSSRGIEVEGCVAGKIGFYTYFTDNQEVLPAYIGHFVDRYRAVPGVDFFTKTSNDRWGVDYLLASGGISVPLYQKMVSLDFGYGKNFIGDGIRSLFLSDFSANYTYLKFKARLGRVKYQSLIMELTPQFKQLNDALLLHKYAVMNHFEINLSRKVKIGLFEGTVFDKGRFEISNVIPVILYNQVNSFFGSPDKVVLGADYKALISRNMNFYGQLIIDGVGSVNAFNRTESWKNRYGVQLGWNLYNFANVQNLDFQAECNYVKPYTYSHFDSMANYTHYNQPLSHPLGANFVELLIKVNYQPVKKWQFAFFNMCYARGIDSSYSNYGTNIFADYDTRVLAAGGKIVNGPMSYCWLFNALAEFEMRRNLFASISYTHRTFWADSKSSSNIKYGNFIVGFRLNFSNRDYLFF